MDVESLKKIMKKCDVYFEDFRRAAPAILYGIFDR